VKFLVELPAALARLLCRLGADCRHVLDLGLGQASDSEIWRYSAADQLVLVSKDEDFFHRAMAPGAPV
jgi:predicted nuclease of predicted toxin-antitoxin system